MARSEPALRVLTLGDLWTLLRRHLSIVLLAALVAGGGTYAFGSLAPARYRATATLYILRQSSESGQTSEEFSLALKVVNDCTYLLKSHAVLDPVIQELQLDMDYAALQEAVSITNPEDSRILAVTAQADSPAMARDIVNTICILGTETIRAVMDYGQIRLYEYAIAETTPCNRPTLTMCLLAAAGGAALVLGLFLLQFLLDDRIQGEEDLEALGIPLLGEVAGLRGREARENWKALRTELLFRAENQQVLAVAGCRRGDGRTTTALQLGRELAALGKQVLVIRADLRRSTDSTGLSQILRGEAALRDCVHATRHPGLFMLPPGKRPEEPVELLSGQAFPALLEEAKEAYDWILLDTPPLDRFIDAAILASHSDGAVLVVRRDGISRQEAEKCLAKLARSGSPVLGAILTHAPTPLTTSE